MVAGTTAHYRAMVAGDQRHDTKAWKSLIKIHEDSKAPPEGSVLAIGAADSDDEETLLPAADAPTPVVTNTETEDSSQRPQLTIKTSPRRPPSLSIVRTAAQPSVHVYAPEPFTVCCTTRWQGTSPKGSVPSYQSSPRTPRHLAEAAAATSRARTIRDKKRQAAAAAKQQLQAANKQLVKRAGPDRDLTKTASYPAKLTTRDARRADTSKRGANQRRAPGTKASTPGNSGAGASVVAKRRLAGTGKGTSAGGLTKTESEPSVLLASTKRRRGKQGGKQGGKATTPSVKGRTRKQSGGPSRPSKEGSTPAGRASGLKRSPSKGVMRIASMDEAHASTRGKGGGGASGGGVTKLRVKHVPVEKEVAEALPATIKGMADTSPTGVKLRGIGTTLQDDDEDDSSVGTLMPRRIIATQVRVSSTSELASPAAGQLDTPTLRQLRTRRNEAKRFLREHDRGYVWMCSALKCTVARCSLTLASLCVCACMNRVDVWMEVDKQVGGYDGEKPMKLSIPWSVTLTLSRLKMALKRVRMRFVTSTATCTTTTTHHH